MNIPVHNKNSRNFAGSEIAFIGMIQIINSRVHVNVLYYVQHYWTLLAVILDAFLLPIANLDTCTCKFCMSVQNWQFPKIAGLYHNCRLYNVVYHQKMIIRYNDDI